MRGLYALKPWYTVRLSRIVRAASRRRLSPDVFTAAGVAAAAAAGVALWQGWWVAAGVLLAARLAGANLDGAVARARGVTRPWGFVLNEIGDRSSDLLMFAGLAALGYRTAGSYGVSAVLLAASPRRCPPSPRWPRPAPARDGATAVRSARPSAARTPWWSAPSPAGWPGCARWSSWAAS